jgi:NAD(P)-dependent dehydrogenase (short-subunit alcohol dehydrogenase family)
MTTILLTGASGYIASHTWLALQSAGFDVVGVDDFSNSSPGVLDRLRELGGPRGGVRARQRLRRGGDGGAVRAPPHRRRGALRGAEGGGRIDTTSRWTTTRTTSAAC